MQQCAGKPNVVGGQAQAASPASQPLLTEQQWALPWALSTLSRRTANPTETLLNVRPCKFCDPADDGRP
jgi:hypothetical protein